jgi:aryl-alcohol dehydrogenase-like predicted oxidoreductase
MQSSELGRSKLKCSRLAYGCWRIAGGADAGLAGPKATATGKKAVTAAYEAGYTLFDLADIYGNGACERIFGKALAEIPEMRRNTLIATKCGIRRKGEPERSSPYRYDFTAEHIVHSCEQSLKRLGIDTVDIYM